MPSFELEEDHVSGDLLNVDSHGNFKLNMKTPKESGDYLLVIKLDDGSFMHAKFHLT